MPVALESVYCIATPALDAWSQSDGPDGQAAQATDVQEVLQLRSGAACAAGQTRLHVNTGDTAAYLVAYDTRLPSVGEASLVFGYGFAMMLALRPLGLVIVEARKIARKLLP